MNIKSNKFKYGSISIVITVLFIVAVILINLLAGVLTDRFSARIDLTSGKVYEISDQTEEMLKNLSEPITVHVLMEENAFKSDIIYARVDEVLNRYRTLSNNQITINYVDIYKNPNFVKNYTGADQMMEGSMVFESARRYQLVPIHKLYTIETNTATGQSYLVGFNAEQYMTSAVQFVTKEQIPVAAVLEGHSETVGQQFTSLLSQNNFEVYSVNLSLADVPEKTSLMVISAPKTDFTSLEMEKIDRYMDNGGSLLVMLGYDSPELPNLNLYLEEWGVRVEQNVVFDMQQAISNPLQIVPNIMNTVITYNISGVEDLLLLTPGSKSIDILWEEKETRTVLPVLLSSDDSYGKAVGESGAIDTYEKADGDLEGPFNIATLSVENRMSGADMIESKVLVIGSALLADDSMLSTTTFLNNSFMTGVTGNLAGQEDSIAMIPKNIASPQLSLTGNAANIIFIILVIAIPAVILVIGLLVWRKRRNL